MSSIHLLKFKHVVPMRASSQDLAHLRNQLKIFDFDNFRYKVIPNTTKPFPLCRLLGNKPSEPTFYLERVGAWWIPDNLSKPIQVLTKEVISGRIGFRDKGDISPLVQPLYWGDPLELLNLLEKASAGRGCSWETVPAQTYPVPKEPFIQFYCFT